jgi:hypothetical protein
VDIRLNARFRSTNKKAALKAARRAVVLIHQSEQDFPDRGLLHRCGDNDRIRCAGMAGRRG